MDNSLKTYSFYSSKGSSKAPARMDSLKSDSFYSSSSSSKVNEVVPPREEKVLSDLSTPEKSFNDSDNNISKVHEHIQMIPSRSSHYTRACNIHRQILDKKKYETIMSDFLSQK